MGEGDARGGRFFFLGHRFARLGCVWATFGDGQLCLRETILRVVRGWSEIEIRDQISYLILAYLIRHGRWPHWSF